MIDQCETTEEAPGFKRDSRQRSQTGDLIASQIVKLSSEELIRLREISHEICELDKQLADLHLCLPTIMIRFYAIDPSSCSSCEFTPTEWRSYTEQLVERTADRNIELSYVGCLEVGDRIAN